MLAIRIKETVEFNPAFSPKASARAKMAREEYNIPCLIRFPIGSEASGDGVVIQCILPQPTMRPADGECHKAVTEYLSHPARREHLKKIKRMAQPEILATLPSGLQRYITSVNNKWEESPIADVVLGKEELGPMLEGE